MISVTSGYKSLNNANHVVIFVPGFPGLFTRHEDLAEVIAAKLKVDTILIQLSGLGSDLSKFSLSGSIEEAATFASNLVLEGRYQSYSLLGHSWGGLVALNILRLAKIKPEKIILLSPLTSLPEEEVMRQLLADYSVVRKAVGAAFDIDELSGEVPQFIQEYTPSHFAVNLKQFAGRIRVLQSLQDDVVPAELVRPFVKEVGITRYEEVEDNHYFLNRSVTIPSVFKLWHDHD